MKQQDLYKILAIFLGLTMVFSIFAYMFLGPSPDTTQQKNEQAQTEKYNQEFWVFSSPFNSISDALRITPLGAESASFIDLDGMPPQMIQWAKQDPTIRDLDSIYKSNTTKMYFANLREGKNSSFLLLSTMFPEKNDFEYIEIPNSYPPILRRTDMNGLYNVMGRPVILAPGDAIMGVLSITESLNKTNTSYDHYENLLNKAPIAPFQTLSSNVSFSKQYYMGIRFSNGSYERTAVYMNLNSSNLKNLTRLKANSTQRGFTEYNITKSGNYTIVKILGPELFSILGEESS